MRSRACQRRRNSSRKRTRSRGLSTRRRFVPAAGFVSTSWRSMAYPKQANERFSNPVGHVAQTMLMLELVQQFDDVSSSDLANKPTTERRKDVIAKAAADALVAFKMPLDVGEIVVSDLGYGPRPGLGFLPILGLALFFGKQVNSLFRGIGDVAGALAGIGKAQSRVGAKYGRSLFLVPW